MADDTEAQTHPIVLACVCVRVFIKLHITAQPGPVILFILCVCLLNYT